MNIEKIVSLCKRRGFVFQSSEIYGGFKAVYDYGPLGMKVLLRKIIISGRHCTHGSISCTSEVESTMRGYTARHFTSNRGVVLLVSYAVHGEKLYCPRVMTAISAAMLLQQSTSRVRGTAWTFYPVEAL